MSNTLSLHDALPIWFGIEGLGMQTPYLQPDDGVVFLHEDSTLLDHFGGVGIEPDEVVYLKQSDAIQGVDTIVEAARSWLAGEGDE